MLPKNPSKNKHNQIGFENMPNPNSTSKNGNNNSNNNANGSQPNPTANYTINPSEIPNVLPAEQFFTMLKEHQSSIINLETKVKLMGNKGKANRNLADELDLLKTELDKKQNADTEIYLRNELNKQEKEIKRLRDEL